MTPERRALIKQYDEHYIQTLELGNTLWFGKHKGESVQDLINSEVTYIRYCLDEKIFELNNEAFVIYSVAIKEHEEAEEHGEIRPE